MMVLYFFDHETVMQQPHSNLLKHPKRNFFTKEWGAEKGRNKKPTYTRSNLSLKITTTCLSRQKELRYA
jgi:hypothetical protein